LARVWVRYVRGLTGEAGVQLEDVVTADVHCIELEAAGYPPGIAGLRQFRQQINAALPDESTMVTQMRFSGPGTIETELHITGTHLGELLGHPATGRTVRFVVHTLGRFNGDRLLERWDRMDFAGLLRQLGPGPQ
jgi:predicted ester cyclase